MADVRALLRAEQAARATTSKPSQPPASTLGKRKAVSEDDHSVQKRSRARDDQIPVKIDGAERIPKNTDGELEAADDGIIEGDSMNNNTENLNRDLTSKTIAIDEDEWAAFERDVASPPASPPRQSALDAIQSKATISAAPRTREEIEAQQKEDVKAQRAQREEDNAAEKEEAARVLEDEFEEMEALEARVQKLKDMREKIRLRNNTAEDNIVGEGGPSVQDGDDDEDDDDDDEADYDDWGFAKR